MKTVLAFLLCGPVCLLAEEPAVPGHVYDNEDLARVSPRRSETGVDTRPESVALAPDVPEQRHGRGEGYWRREAEHVRRTVARWRDQAFGLKTRIEEAHQKEADKARAGGRGGKGSSRRVASGTRAPVTTAALEARRQLLERRIRDEESSLDERARRDGALPGWLR